MHQLADQVLTAPASILQSPCKRNYFPDASLRCKIVIYFTNVYHKPFHKIIKWLPEVMQQWRKSHIIGGGDRVCTAWAQSQCKKYCDASFVQVSVQYYFLILSN